MLARIFPGLRRRFAASIVAPLLTGIMARSSNATQATMRGSSHFLMIAGITTSVVHRRKFGAHAAGSDRPADTNDSETYEGNSKRPLKNSAEGLDSDAQRLEASVTEQITTLLATKKVVLFMKGTPEAPKCGYSARTVKALLEAGCKDFTFVDVTKSDLVRQAVKSHSKWLTLPQLFVEGEFIGGCDVVTTMHQTGDLKKLLESKGLLNAGPTTESKS